MSWECIRRNNIYMYVWKTDTTSRYTFWVQYLETEHSHLCIGTALNRKKAHHHIYRSLMITTPLRWGSNNSQRQNDCVFDTMKTDSCATVDTKMQNVNSIDPQEWRQEQLRCKIMYIRFDANLQNWKFIPIIYLEQEFTRSDGVDKEEIFGWTEDNWFSNVRLVVEKVCILHVVRQHRSIDLYIIGLHRMKKHSQILITSKVLQQIRRLRV